MHKHEQVFLTKLGKWWVHEGHSLLPPMNYHVEAKISQGNLFNFKSGIKSHQGLSLINFSTKPVAWKISDAAMVTQMCDSIFSNPKTTCGIFIFFWIRPRNKTFYIISPESIQVLIDAGRKSMNEAEALSIATFVGTLK